MAHPAVKVVVLHGHVADQSLPAPGSSADARSLGLFDEHHLSTSSFAAPSLMLSPIFGYVGPNCVQREDERRSGAGDTDGPIAKAAQKGSTVKARGRKSHSFVEPLGVLWNVAVDACCAGPGWLGIGPGSAPTALGRGESQRYRDA
jgi:hypothetical protein